MSVLMSLLEQIAALVLTSLCNPRRCSDLRPSRLLRDMGVATLVLGIVALVSKLALAPVHGVHKAAECREAYAKAVTRQDSMSVDFASFPDSAGRNIAHRCNEVLPKVVQPLGQRRLTAPPAPPRA
ncbi:hypothetical protein [Gemmatimonas sp.]|uniref:hypothetical protein n=1 Tax=Gemmatimonas sp. TaxID=1962908 RepID=UPI003F70741F